MYSQVLKIVSARLATFHAFEAAVLSAHKFNVSYLSTQIGASERAVTNSGSIAWQIEPK